MIVLDQAVNFGRMNTKAQMKIQQMAFMLIAVTILFVLAGMAFLVLNISNTKEAASELREMNARKLVLRLADSPEFSCGESYGNLKTGCVDYQKVLILSQENHIKKYENFWGVSKIEIHRLYPQEDGETICTLNNSENCDVIQILDTGKSGISRSNYVNLCKKEILNGDTYNKCELARLIVWPENVE